MKYTALFAVTSWTIGAVAADGASANAQRGLATLAEKWNLPEPTFAFEGNTFNLTFPVTDFINTGMVQYSLWLDNECQEGGNSLAKDDGVWAQSTLIESAALAAASVFPDNQLDSGEFNGREATIVSEFNPAVISTSSIYREVTNGQVTSAVISFCVRVGLWTTTSMGINTPVEVNFLETIITLFVDLTDGFTIGEIDVTPRDRLIETANVAYEVRGYECVEGSNAVRPSGDPRNQGDVITICVVPEDDASAAGIFMRSIDEFTFTRDGQSQVAIQNNAEASNLLTSYSPSDCQGNTYCTFSTILFAQFYGTAGTVAGAGTATLQFGQAGAPAARMLRATGRDLQEQDEEGAGAAEFDLQFEVNQAAVRGSSGASSMGAAMSVGALAFAAALL